eukprot:404841_1
MEPVEIALTHKVENGTEDKGLTDPEKISDVSAAIVMQKQNKNGSEKTINNNELQNKSTIKINNSVDKIKHCVINNWMESGFIEHMRSQIRCQLIRELKHPFKHQKNGVISMNHLSLNQKILNTIIIDYLTKYNYNYSLSVFKSEIGGELIGSLSYNDTYNQLQLSEYSTMSIIEQLINDKKNNLDCKINNNQKQFILERKQLETLKTDLELRISQINKERNLKFDNKLLLKQETIKVKQLQQDLQLQLKLSKMDEPSKFKELQSELNNANQTILKLQNKINIFEDNKVNHIMKEIDNEWHTKYNETYKQLMDTLKRENEMQCLLDEGNIKLKSAKREINYLEQLLQSQKIVTNNESNIELLQKNIEYKESEENEIIPKNIYTQNEINKDLKISLDKSHNIMCSKYEELELDLKKRLRMQAMLETDSRKLTYHTKKFFDQLNQQKTQTAQIINKLESTTPKFNDNYVINQFKQDEYKNMNECIEINSEKKEEFEIEKRKNRQSYIYYNLDKLKRERHEMQQEIREKVKRKTQQITECKQSDINDKYIEINQNQNVNNDVIIEDTSNKIEIKETEIIVEDVIDEYSIEKNIDNNNDIIVENNLLNNEQQSTNTINDKTETNEMTRDEIESNLAVIDEDKEHCIENIDINTNEYDILEKEKLEQDLMNDDDDCTQSESFSGVDFLHSDFLQQYQKHIENMNNE